MRAMQDDEFGSKGIIDNDQYPYWSDYKIFTAHVKSFLNSRKIPIV